MKKPAFRPEIGFSLVEVLVSIVVLSFGLLGMAGMQAAALHSNREARLQSSAVIFARELADMIRGNRSMSMQAINPDSSNPYLFDLSSPLTAPNPEYCLAVSSSTACDTATKVANAEVTEWLARIDQELPGVQVKSCKDSAPFDATTGLPTWTCTNTIATNTIVIKIGWNRSSTNKSNKGAAALERASDRNSVPPLVVLQVTAGV